MNLYRRLLYASQRLLALATLLPLLGFNVAASTNPAASAPTAAMEADIRDIRPPIHITSAWLWMAWTLGGLSLAAMGYGAWRWWGRGELRMKLPYELALEELEAARRLMQPEHARAFSIIVSEVVRNYIERLFAVRAAHRTTEEFLRDLVSRTDTPLAAHRESLGDFLHHCDLAKFARWALTVPQMESMLQSASAFIIATGKPAENTDDATAHSRRFHFLPKARQARLNAPPSELCSPSRARRSTRNVWVLATSWRKSNVPCSDDSVHKSAHNAHPL